MEIEINIKFEVTNFPEDLESRIELMKEMAEDGFLIDSNIEIKNKKMLITGKITDDLGFIIRS